MSTMVIRLAQHEPEVSEGSGAGALTNENGATNGEICDFYSEERVF